MTPGTQSTSSSLPHSVPSMAAYTPTAPEVPGPMFLFSQKDSSSSTLHSSFYDGSSSFISPSTSLSEFSKQQRGSLSSVSRSVLSSEGAPYSPPESCLACLGGMDSQHLFTVKTRHDRRCGQCTYTRNAPSLCPNHRNDSQGIFASLASLSLPGDRRSSCLSQVIRGGQSERRTTISQDARSSLLSSDEVFLSSPLFSKHLVASSEPQKQGISEGNYVHRKGDLSTKETGLSFSCDNGDGEPLSGEVAPGAYVLNETAAWAGQPSAENFPLPVAPCYQAPAFRGGIDQITCNTSSSPISPAMPGDSLLLSSDPFYFSIAASLGDGFLPPRLLAYRKEALERLYSPHLNLETTSQNTPSSEHRGKPQRSARRVEEESGGSRLEKDSSFRDTFSSSYCSERRWIVRRRERTGRDAIKVKEEEDKEEANICRNALALATEASSQQHDELIHLLTKCISGGRGRSKRDNKGLRGDMMVPTDKEDRRRATGEASNDVMNDRKGVAPSSTISDSTDAQRSGWSGPADVRDEQARCEGEEKKRDSDTSTGTGLNVGQTGGGKEPLDSQRGSDGAANIRIQSSFQKESHSREAPTSLQGKENVQQEGPLSRGSAKDSIAGRSLVTPSPGHQGEFVRLSSSGSVPSVMDAASRVSPSVSVGQTEVPTTGNDGPCDNRSSASHVDDKSSDMADGGSGSYSDELEGVSSASEDEDSIVQVQVQRSLLLRCLRDLLQNHFSSLGGAFSSSPSSLSGERTPNQEKSPEALLRQERILALLLRRVQEREEQGVPDLLLSPETSRTLKEQLIQVLLAEVLTDISVQQLQSDRMHQVPCRYASFPSGGNKPPNSVSGTKKTSPCGLPNSTGISSSTSRVTGGSAGGGGAGFPTPLAILQRLVSTQRAQAAHAEDQADATAVAAGRSALASLAQQFPRLASLVTPLSGHLANLPRLFHLRLQLLQQQVQRAGTEETAETIYHRIMSLVREYESTPLSRMPFGSAVSTSGTSRSTLEGGTSGAGSGVHTPQGGNLGNALLGAGGLSTSLLHPEALGSSGGGVTGDSLSSSFSSASSGSQPYGMLSKGGVLGGLAGHLVTTAVGGKDDTGVGGGVSGAMPPPQALPAPKKPSRKGMGMSGWALFAKEKRAELQQSGQLEGDTLPEQTSFVARFWHQLSKEAKAEWGRRAEELNRQAGLRMKKEEEKKQQQRQQQQQVGGTQMKEDFSRGQGFTAVTSNATGNGMSNGLSENGMHAASSTTAAGGAGGGGSVTGLPGVYTPQLPGGGMTLLSGTTPQTSSIPQQLGQFSGTNMGGGERQGGQNLPFFSLTSRGGTDGMMPTNHLTPNSSGGTASSSSVVMTPLSTASSKKKSRSAGGGSKKGSGAGGDAPKGRGYTAFTLFAKEMRQKCREEGIECGSSLSEQNTFIGDKWRQVSPAEKKIFQRRAKEANEAWKRQQKEQEAAQAADVSAALQSGSIPPSTNTQVPQVHQGSPFTILPGQQSSSSTPTSDATHHLGGQQQQPFTADNTLTSSLDQRPPPSTFPTTSMGSVSTNSPLRCPQGASGSGGGVPGFSLIDSSGHSTPQTLSSAAGTSQSGVTGPNASSSFAYIEARRKDSAQTPLHPLSHPPLQGGGSGRVTPPSSPYHPVPSSRGGVLPSPSGGLQQHLGSPLPSDSSIHLLQSGSIRPSPYASLGKRDLTTASLGEPGGSGMPVQKKQRGEDREQQDPSISGGYASSQTLHPGRAGLEGPHQQQQPSLPPQQHTLPSLGDRDLAGGIMGNGNLLDRRESVSSTYTSSGVMGGEGGPVPGRSASSSSSAGGDVSNNSFPPPHHQHLHHQPSSYNSLTDGEGDKRTFSSLSSPSPPEPMSRSSFSSQQTPVASANHHRLGLVASSPLGDGDILREGRGQSYVFQQEALSPPPGSLPPGFSRSAAQNRGGERDGDPSMPPGSSSKPGGGVPNSGDRGGGGVGGMPMRMMVSQHDESNSHHFSRDPWNEGRDREDVLNSQPDNRTRQFVSDPVCTAVPPPSSRMSGIEEHRQHTSLMYEEHPSSLSTFTCSSLYKHHANERIGEFRQSNRDEAPLNLCNVKVDIHAQGESGMREEVYSSEYKEERGARRRCEVYSREYKEEEIPSSSVRETQTSLLFRFLPLTPPLEETETVVKTSVGESSSDLSSERTWLDLDEKTMTGCVQLDVEEETGGDCRLKGNVRGKRFRAEAFVEAVPPERERRARDSRDGGKEEPRKQGKMTNGEETRGGRHEKKKRQSHREKLESEEDESDEEVVNEDGSEEDEEDDEEEETNLLKFEEKSGDEEEDLRKVGNEIVDSGEEEEKEVEEIRVSSPRSSTGSRRKGPQNKIEEDSIVADDEEKDEEEEETTQEKDEEEEETITTRRTRRRHAARRRQVPIKKESEDEDDDVEDEEESSDEDDEDFCPSSFTKSSNRKNRRPSQVSKSSSVPKKSSERVQENQEVIETKEKLQLSQTKDGGDNVKRLRRKPTTRTKRTVNKGDSDDLQQMTVPVSIVEKEEGPLTLWDLVQRNKRRRPPGATAAARAQKRAAAAEQEAQAENAGKTTENPDIFGSLLLDGALGGGGEAAASSAPQSHNSNNSNDVLSLLFSPSPSSTRPSSSHPLSGNQDSRKDSGTGDAVDFAGLFDAAPGGRYGAGGGGGGGALRLDADGKLVMSAEALAEEEDVTTDRPVCTCGASFGLFDGVGGASACVCLFNGRRRVVEEGGAGGMNALSLQPYAGAYRNTKGKKWTEEETKMFYSALEQYGTDLLLVRTLLPHVTDKQLKVKLKVEEKRNPQKVEAALTGQRRQLTLEAYEGVHGKINPALHYTCPLASSSSSSEEDNAMYGSRKKQQTRLALPAPPPPPPPPASSSSSSFPSLLSILADAAPNTAGGDPAGVVDSSLFTIPVGMSSGGGIGGDAGDDLLALFG
ncbi:myb-like dna-binding high mobility group box domain-containing [Cystoisospora suis]|uniref:Myb-like dna-binding high mobility group box domain-containing n=1 Tax=Cystoisospora suis TaxID=483139 RepID=A0A2C6LE22_9APIC|nr:myb-like dna-binding high mobility group box domain-containing [Cystoisospora suis]